MQKFSFLILVYIFLYASDVVAQNINLSLSGASSSETATINSYDYERLHKDYNSILSSLETLQQQLYKDGYLESHFQDLKKANDSTFTCIVTLHTKYDTLLIHYDSTQINPSIIEAVSDNNSFNLFEINIADTERILNLINSKISEQGFPFSRLKLSELKITSEQTVEAQLLVINDEKKRGLDKIILKGYEKFSDSYLKHYLKIKPETTFNIESIKKKVQQLKNLQFAKQIKEPEVLFSKDSTVLYLYIEKTQSNAFDGFLGFSTNPETNALELNGYIDLNLNNNLNYGESFKILYKSDENEQKLFDAQLNLPYLFQSPIGTELELNILKRDSSFTTVRQQAKLYYQIDSKSRVFIGIDATESNVLLDDHTNTLLSDYKSKFYDLKYDYEQRRNEDPLFQIRSTFSIEAGLGNRSGDTSKIQQSRFQLAAHHIIDLNATNSIFLRLQSALLSSDAYLENELMRFGGINSIRGFQENSLSATLFGVLNTEYRYKLSPGIYVHSIIDYAYLENQVIAQKEHLYGFGLGFGLLTQAGLLKFNFANGKTENQSFKFSNSKVHLSLTARF